MLDVTNGILYIAIAVVDPRKPETIVVTVLQDAAGMQLWARVALLAGDAAPWAEVWATVLACLICRQQLVLALPLGFLSKC